MIWTQGFVELLRWRHQRRLLAAQAALLVIECQRYLADEADGRAPGTASDPRHPPRPRKPPRR